MHAVVQGSDHGRHLKDREARIDAQAGAPCNCAIRRSCRYITGVAGPKAPSFYHHIGAREYRRRYIQTNALGSP